MNCLAPAPTIKFRLAALFTGSLFLCACESPSPHKATEPREVHTTDYDLVIPAEQKALLILFPCFPCDAADTRSESSIAGRAVVDYL